MEFETAYLNYVSSMMLIIQQYVGGETKKNFLLTSSLIVCRIFYSFPESLM